MRWKFVVSLLFAVASLNVYALGTNRAAGTPVVQPKNPVNNETCLACHQTINKLHNRGAHKNVNCGSCHTVPAEHMSAPGPKTRPATNFAYESCSQCHSQEHKDLMDPKYHYAWARKGGNNSYAFIRDTEDGWPRILQQKLPRFHSGLMVDLVANRANGRFKCDSKKEQAVPQNKPWNVLSDTAQENTDQMQGDTIGIGWRPHKGRETSQLSYCMRCKTTDNILEYKYEMGENPGGLQIDSPVVPLIKNIKSGFNCNFCHDPHSAEPRIIFDPLIESMTGKDGKDNIYQQNVGSKGMTPIEVVEMGVRGYKRKIGILKDYNANFMCGNCHNAANRYLTFSKVSDGKKVTEEDLKKAGVNFYSTEFHSDPISSWKFFKKLGWYDGIDKTTNVKQVKGNNHAHVEILISSKHGKAGVTCTDCHFAKIDNRFEHQPSLPKEKVQNTCMRSECHGPGSKDNWTDYGQALYTIEAIQQEYRIRTQKMEMEAKVAQKLLNRVKEGEIEIPEPQLKNLKNAYEKHLATRDFYLTDYSQGFHDPEGFNRTASQVVWEFRKVNSDAQKVMKKLNSAAVKTTSGK